MNIKFVCIFLIQMLNVWILEVFISGTLRMQLFKDVQQRYVCASLYFITEKVVTINAAAKRKFMIRYPERNPD